jgi:hypothetical protein
MAKREKKSSALSKLNKRLSESGGASVAVQVYEAPSSSSSSSSSTINRGTKTHEAMQSVKSDFDTFPKYTKSSPSASNTVLMPSRASVPPQQAKAAPPAPPREFEPVIKWVCNDCRNECIPVIRESRCLCGHRLKDHPARMKQSSASKDTDTCFPCSNKSCKCTNFFYIVAEGAWILRCKCKHKHIEHNCEAKPFFCQKCPAPGVISSSKSSQSCTGFDSPWVCNCGHVWGAHTQVHAYLAYIVY